MKINKFGSIEIVNAEPKGMKVYFNGFEFDMEGDFATDRKFINCIIDAIKFELTLNFGGPLDKPLLTDEQGQIIRKPKLRLVKIL